MHQKTIASSKIATVKLTFIEFDGRGHPVWNMRADKNVMRSHGDIWNEDFTRMLLSMMGGLETVPLKSYSPAMRRLTQ
jgi:hypothetical protein